MNHVHLPRDYLPISGASSLTWEGATPRPVHDSGISIVQGEVYFGDGTKLIVLDKNDKIRNANISIFEPSPEEIKEKGKATVVCLVTDFYPDNIEIEWFVDDMVKKANDPSIQTDLNSISSEGNKSFSISSRLRLDAQDWIWVKTIKCAVKHYIGASDVDESNYTLHIKAATCGVSKEAKMQSMGAAKLTYLTLICKSIFYGLFVSILAWKTKTSYSKRFD